MSDETTVTPGVAAAAAWWASRLGTVPESASFPSPRRYSAEEAERFRVALEAAIAAHLRGEVPELRAHSVRGGLYFSSEGVVQFDYDPDETLCAAAEQAGITLGWTSMPRKIMMLIDESGVRVADGYAAPWETLWEPS